MSVQTNQYLMLGVKLPYTKEAGLYEKFEGYYDSAYEGIVHKDGLCVVFDGMNGEYILVGRVLEKSGVHQTIDGPLDLTALVSSESAMEKELLAGMISLKFGIENPDIRLWFVTHYR